MKRNTGFTLIEFLIVICLIATVALIILPPLNKRNNQTVGVDVRREKIAEDFIYDMYGRYPDAVKCSTGNICTVRVGQQLISLACGSHIVGCRIDD